MSFSKLVPIEEIQHLIKKDEESTNKIAGIKKEIDAIEIGQVLRFEAEDSTRAIIGAPGLSLVAASLDKKKFKTYTEGNYSYIHRVK